MISIIDISTFLLGTLGCAGIMDEVGNIQIEAVVLILIWIAWMSLRLICTYIYDRRWNNENKRRNW